MLTDEQIKQMSKENFKHIVKVKVEIFASNYLNEIKQSHTKIRQLKMEKFSPSEFGSNKKTEENYNLELILKRNEMKVGIQFPFQQGNLASNFRGWVMIMG